MRSRKSDYLAYSLIDVIVDHYFVVLEEISEQIESLEDEIFTKSGVELLSTLGEFATRDDRAEEIRVAGPRTY